jgi:hypothetical protein
LLHPNDDKTRSESYETALGAKNVETQGKQDVNT